VSNERALTILLSPHVSEKCSQAAGVHRLYGFKVAKDATKPEIKQAVEQLFSVKVRSVRVTNVKSKPARFGKIRGRHSAWKKAYVTLTQGQEIDLAG
jgi:large subunit ribosomal protein L23